MARKMKKFSAGGAQGRYDRRMADIDKDRKIALGKGKNSDVAEAKAAQRIADAKDDLAKRTGADRSTTRAAEKAAESNLTKTRKYGAVQSVTKDTAGPTGKVADSLSKLTAPKSDIKPQSFGAAFKDARSRLGAGKTFTYNGKSFTTNIAGEGKRTGTGTGTTPKPAATTPKPAATTPKPAATTPKPAATTPPAALTSAQLRAQAEATRKRTSNMPGNAGSRERLADIFGMSSADRLETRANNARTSELIAKEQAGRAKAQTTTNQKRAAADRKEEFINRKVEGETGLQRIVRINQETAAKKAKGGSIKKETTMDKKPMPMGGKQLVPTKKKPPKEPITGGADTVPLTPGRKEFLKQLAERNAKPGMAKGGKMASCGMKKGGKMATKFGAAMKKKSADTKGRAMVKMAAGGSASKRADGCAIKGKTKGKMLAKGGMVGYKRGGKTC